MQEKLFNQDWSFAYKRLNLQNDYNNNPSIFISFKLNTALYPEIMWLAAKYIVLMSLTFIQWKWFCHPVYPVHISDLMLPQFALGNLWISAGSAGFDLVSYTTYWIAYICVNFINLINLFTLTKVHSCLECFRITSGLTGHLCKKFTKFQLCYTVSQLWLTHYCHTIFSLDWPEVYYYWGQLKHRCLSPECLFC